MFVHKLLSGVGGGGGWKDPNVNWQGNGQYSLKLSFLTLQKVKELVIFANLL